MTDVPFSKVNSTNDLQQMSYVHTGSALQVLVSGQAPEQQAPLSAVSGVERVRGLGGWGLGGWAGNHVYCLEDNGSHGASKLLTVVFPPHPRAAIRKTGGEWSPGCRENPPAEEECSVLSC